MSSDYPGGYPGNIFGGNGNKGKSPLFNNAGNNNNIINNNNGGYINGQSGNGLVIGGFPSANNNNGSNIYGQGGYGSAIGGFPSANNNIINNNNGSNINGQGGYGLTIGGFSSANNNFINNNNGSNINGQGGYGSTTGGFLSESSSQMGNQQPALINNESLAEFRQRNQLIRQHLRQVQLQKIQQPQQQQLQQQQLQQQPQQLQQQQQQLLQQGMYIRNVKPRLYQQNSPISPLSPMDFSGSSISTSDVSIFSNNNVGAPRNGLPVFHQLRQQQQSFSLGSTSFNGRHNFSASLPLPNLTATTSLVRPEPENTLPNLTAATALVRPESEQTLFNFTATRALVRPEPENTVPNLTTTTALVRPELDQTLPNLTDSTALVRPEQETEVTNSLEEVEKFLLSDTQAGDDDNDNANIDNDWAKNLIISPLKNSTPIIPSPASSPSSSFNSTSLGTPPTTCPKQSLIEAATAISDNKSEDALKILTRLSQISNKQGSSEQRLVAHMEEALRSRVSPDQYPPQLAELYEYEHMVATQILYDKSPCFKLAFMAANLAIVDVVKEAVKDQVEKKKIHVVDFDIGKGGQYQHLLDELSTLRDNLSSVKITAFNDFVTGSEERLKHVGEGLKEHAEIVGVSLSFNILNSKITDLTSEVLGVEKDEVLFVNFAFKLYKTPDESVSTDNLRDELLRRVKALSPKIVTVVEQEMNGNTAGFVTRVTEACGYYGALLDSLDKTFYPNNLTRSRIEDGLGRKMTNSVACEGSDRVERSEVFGKWQARLRMAGFEPKPMSQTIAESLRAKVESAKNGNPGFIVKEDNGGICFGWKERTLVVASTWI